MVTAAYTQTADLTSNRLLAALPADEYARLRPQLTVVHLGVGDSIYAPFAPVRQAYFPLTGVASVVAAMADGAMVEVGTVGREGLVGLAAFLDADGGPLETFAQVPGDYARLPVAALRYAAAPGTALHTLLHRFSQALYILAAQSGACNRLHPVEERCARWLLLTHDRVGAKTFTLTHEYLGYMLGTHRPGVTVAMGTLQQAGLVTYQRGEVTILDHAGLADAACECYTLIVNEYDRLLGREAPGRRVIR